MKQLMSNAYGPRYRTTCRAGARLVLSASIAIAVAGCSEPPEICRNGVLHKDYNGNGIYTTAVGWQTVKCIEPSDTDGHPQGGNAKQVPSDSLTVGPEGDRP